MIITSHIKYIGANDHEIDLFEGQYPVPNGMSYNSYLILDDKTAVMDTIDAHFTEQWLMQIDKLLEGAEPDYLIVQHMEPDHSASIYHFMAKYPRATIIAEVKAFFMMEQFFGTEYSNRRIIVKDGDTVSLGKHCLHFFTAPMVHWPEVIMTYESSTGTLFSADAFGKFGALDIKDNWIDEARRYYFGIVGKYGVQVQRIIKKLIGPAMPATTSEIVRICSLHGPVLSENISYYLNLYNTWASYEPEVDGILIAYTSMYGNTTKAAEYLFEQLQNIHQTLPESKVKSVSEFPPPNICLIDLARSDIFEAVAQTFRYSKLVLAAPTYNATVFPRTREFIQHLLERNYQNRTVAFIENGSWAPVAARAMKELFAQSPDIHFCETTVTIRSSMTDENCRQLELLAKEMRSHR